jgi:hypothetical protein
MPEPDTTEQAPFEPTALKFVTPEGYRQERVAGSPEEYEQMHNAGWRASWSELGIETAPSTSVTTLNAPEVPPQASPETYQEVLRLLVAYEQEMRALTARVEALEAQVAALGVPPTAPEPSTESPEPVERSQRRGRGD